MSLIQDKLDELASLRSALDVINLEKQSIIDSILTPEIKQKLAEIDLEFSGKSEVATDKASVLEAEIKELVKSAGETVKSKYFMAVYMKGRVSWNSDVLERISIDHPEILFARKEGEPSVSLRRI
jgi:hypothetical protein